MARWRCQRLPPKWSHYVPTPNSNDFTIFSDCVLTVWLNRDGKILLLQARNGNASMMVGSNATESLAPANKTKLVFNQYGSRYFLSQIWVNGETLGRQLPKTSREKEMARDLAQNLERGQVEIVASLQK